jgi:hypothetical protein
VQDRLHLCLPAGINNGLLLDASHGNSASGQVDGKHTAFLQLSTKKGVTMNRKIKNIFFTAMAATVLCAGTLSARQLSLVVQDTTCQHHFCTRTNPCPNVLGCGCVFNNPNATSGVCGFIAAKR